VACRTYGPPLSFGARPAPHCPLCFDGASPDVVEDCRVDPDPDGIEDALLAEMGVADTEVWETLVAFALVGEGE